MSITIGGKLVSDIVINNKDVQRITDILTSEIIFEKAADITDYLYIQNTYNGTNTISLKTKGSGTVTNQHATVVEYSKDKIAWTSITLTRGNTATIPMATGEKVYFRNNSGYWNELNFFTEIQTSGSSVAGGDILSLLDYENLGTVSMYQCCFYCLFYENTGLTSAANLTLPSSTADSCFQNMFSGCTSLVNTPALPSTTLENECYEGMFNECTSLVNAPVLPATTLATYCYSSMFRYCYSLTNPPVLPATSLANYCYENMFSYCTSLTSAPVLPATIMASHCYEGMFAGCTSLTTAPALPSTSTRTYCYARMFGGCTSLTESPALPSLYPAQYAYYRMFYNCSSLNHVICYAENESAYQNSFEDWLYGVAASGVFENLGDRDFTENSSSGIPSGWSERNYLRIINGYNGSNTVSFTKYTNGTPPSASGNYTETFQYSKDGLNFTTADLTSTSTVNVSLNATEVLYVRNNNGLWNYMTSSNEHEIQITASQNHYVTGKICSLLDYEHPNTVVIPMGAFASLFNNNTKLTAARRLKLPSQALSSKAFNKSFISCTSLTTAPELPATTLGSECYQQMFRYCSSLTTAPSVIPATTATYMCCQRMFSDCTALTSAPELPMTTVGSGSYQYMFYGCSSLTAGPSELPATTLVLNCYYEMFRGCSKLTSAPVIKATTYGENSCRGMFYSCSSLNSLVVYVNDISASNCTTSWLNGVASSGTFHRLGTQPTSRGVSGIPTNWTIVNS